MKFLLSICIMIFLTIMQIVSNLFPMPPSAAENKFIRQYSERMGEKYEMSVVGLGGSEEDGKVKTIAIHFAFYGSPMNREEARKLILDCTNEFLSQINSDEQIRPYLKSYPYPPANVDLVIFCSNVDKTAIFDPYIDVVSCLLGYLNYKTTDRLHPNLYKAVIRETYGEGLAILKQQEGDQAGQ